jgi:hypothetical protein
MVYSIVCRWLDDYLADEELEISDTWDFMEWVEESEILEVFQDCVLKTLKHERSRNDAEMILYSLLWEYYLLRRDLSNSQIKPDEGVWARLESTSLSGEQQWFIEKRNLVSADEFHLMLSGSKMRKGLVRSKVSKRIPEGDVHAVTLAAAAPASAAWGHKYGPVIQSIYAKEVASARAAGGGKRYRHPTLTRLAAEPDGVVVSGPRAGRLLKVDAPVSRLMESEIITDPHYIELQVMMEICDVAAADYCECYISAGPTWKLGLEVAAGGSVGAVAVVGLPDAAETWRYVYSPLYENTAEGRRLAEAWTPVAAAAAAQAEEQAQAQAEEQAEAQVLEKHLWEVEKIQTITVRRNPRWWAAVGLPAYVDFWKHVDVVRSDPMFLSPAFLDEGDLRPPALGLKTVGPMFVD